MRTKSGNKDKKILEAAAQIFAEKGFSDTKISDIAKKANVAVGSVYLYYEDKESIQKKIMGKIWKDSYETILQIYDKPSQDLREKIFKIINAVLQYLSENEQISRLITHEQNFGLFLKKGIHVEYHHKFFDLIVNMLEEGKQNGDINPDIDSEILTTFLMGAIRYMVFSWQRGELLTTRTKLNKQIEMILLTGIFT